MLYIYVVSDVLIVSIYLILAGFSGYLLLRQKSGTMSRTLAIAALFMIGSGLTQIIDLISIWHPTPDLHGILKAMTASTAVALAFALIRAIPKTLALQQTNQDLESVIDQRTQELLRAKEQAEKASLAKSSLVAFVSHEIRTPLGIISGFSDLLQEPNLTQKDVRVWASAIKRNCDLLSTIINDLLDVSKVEAGKLDIEPMQVNPAEIVEDVYNLFRSKANEKGIELKIDYITPLPEKIESDPIRLKQILINIVGNALKFTEKGCVVLRAGLHAVESGITKLMLEVEDTGRGIPPDQVEVIFEPFAQSDKSTTRKYGGTGLGLTLARALARRLGGDVVIRKTEPGKGSVFRITIDPELQHV